MRRPLAVLALSLSLLLPAAGPAALAPAPARGDERSLVALFNYLSQAVGALYVKNESGDLGFLCTVTVVERGAAPSPAGGEVVKYAPTVVLTANHCVKKDVAYSVTFDGKRFYEARVWKIPHEDLDKNKYPRHFGEPKTDMALFIIDEPLSDVKVVPLGSDEKMVSGKKIAVVGFPLGVAKISYEGSIAGRFNRPGDDQNGYLLIQSFGAPGSSGSAVVDVETETVVGVLVNARQASVGLPVIFVTPVSYRKYLIEIPAAVQSYESDKR